MGVEEKHGRLQHSVEHRIMQKPVAFDQHPVKVGTPENIESQCKKNDTTKNNKIEVAVSFVVERTDDGLVVGQLLFAACPV